MLSFQVIGPYRSGKSFLLNQLLSLSCYEGDISTFLLMELLLVGSFCTFLDIKVLALDFVQDLVLDTCVTQKLRVIGSNIVFPSLANYHLLTCWFHVTGIWVWGLPIELDIDGVKTSVFYLDTEGFESVGKSNVYDDR